jgi:hypothetical protein
MISLAFSRQLPLVLRGPDQQPSGQGALVIECRSENYDARQFLGLRQLIGEDFCPVLSEGCTLDQTGILSVIRHPWYVGGMLIVWARDLDLGVLISNLIFTGYVIVGSVLEERKLSLEFGDVYRDYRRRVPMFFPYQWLKSRLKFF